MRVPKKAISVVLFLAPRIAAAAGELPDLAPQVRSIAPLGGRAGETLDVRISGRRLDGTLDVTFARPDIRAEVVSSDFSTVKLKVSVARHVPTGLHDYRLRTPRGTLVGVFHIAALKAVGEVEPNNDVGHAQPIALPAIVDGSIGPGDYDVFRFHAETGETFIFDVLARRAGSTLDSSLSILDERGNELDFIDDYYIHKDPYLAFAAKRSGDYFVRVSATAEGRPAADPYRLVAGALPHMLRVLPAGARRGASNQLRISGLNLDRIDRFVLGEGLAEGRVVTASPDSLTLQVDIPASVPAGRYPLRAFSKEMEAPLPITLLVSDLAEHLAAPARTRALPQSIRLPGAFSGVLDQRGAAHFFTFEAQAGERLVFDVDAMKLGYLVDPVVAIYDPDGRLLASDDDRLQQNGDQPPNLDPYLVHTLEKAGRYIVMIRDLARRGDTNYVYRLAIYPGIPDFDVKGLTPSITVYRGKTGVLPVRVRRHGGWDTPVEVWVENLPAGVTSEKRIAEPKPTIAKDNCALEHRLDGTNVDLPLHLSHNAALGSHPLQVRARGVWNGRIVEHTAEIFYKWDSVGKVTGPIADQTLVATVAELPQVILEPPETLTLIPGKPARMRVLVTRLDGATTALPIEPESPVEGLTFENNVLPPGAAQIELRITTSGSVKARAFRLRAGPALSQFIALKMHTQSEEDQE